MDEIIQANVVYKTNKGTPVTDSLKVAQVFGRLHKNVIRSIREIIMSANLLSQPPSVLRNIVPRHARERTTVVLDDP